MARKSIKDVAEITPEQVAEAIQPVVVVDTTDEKAIEPVAEAGTTENEAVQESAAIKQKIYVGPNLLGLPKYTVIETDFTVHMNGFIEKCPEVKKLFVPIAEMADIEKRIDQKGTLEHRHYQKVIAFKNAVRKDDR